MSSSAAPRTLHPVAMLLAAQRAIRQWVSTFLFFGVTRLPGGIDRRDVALALLGVAIVIGGSAIQGFLQWRATRYWVDGGAFHLRRGVVSKRERSIPLDHIQSVDVSQGLLQRLFGVLEVRVESAGGGQGGEADAALPALSRVAATELQAELAARTRTEDSGRRGVQLNAPTSDPTESSVPGTLRVPGSSSTAEPVVIRKLSFGMLLLAGATSGQIGIAAPVLATVSQLFDDVLPTRYLERIVEEYLPRSVGIVLVIAVAVPVFAWLISIFGAVYAYTGFTLTRQGENLRIRRGLLERSEVTIPMGRIQAIRVIEGPLRQPLGMATLRIDSAGIRAGRDAAVSTTLFPLLPRAAVRALLEAAAPEFAVEAPFEPLPSRSARRYVVGQVLGVSIPVALLVGAAVAPRFLSADTYPARLSLALLAAAVVLVLLAAAYGLVKYRGAGYAVADDCLLLRWRRLARTTLIAPRRRLQSRSLSENLFQRRAGLGTLGVRVASGGGGTGFELDHLDSDAARGVLARLGPARVAGATNNE